MVVFVDEDNGDVDNIPSDGEGLDGDDETSDESEADSSSDVSQRVCARPESVINLGIPVVPVTADKRSMLAVVLRMRPSCRYALPRFETVI